MLRIYIAENNTEWSSDKLDEMMQPLPQDMQQKILAYRGWQERQARILGKHMLLKLLKDFDLSLTLADLRYTEFNKPYLSSGFDFSIAHSNEIVICAGAINAEIGADIEKMLPIEISDYEDHLTTNEWNLIHKASDVQIAFYQIWTKKEALLKALGKGVNIDFKKLDVSSDRISYDERTYWFFPLSVRENYMAHIATTAPHDTVSTVAVYDSRSVELSVIVRES
jgi:4'-phosphopantetheinyl transferase